LLKKRLNRWLYEQVRKIFMRQSKVELQNIKVEEYNISYLESTHKSDKTLIMIHGLNDEKESWLILAASLKDRYHLIIIDLLGCGESDLPMDFEYTLRNQAHFLEKIIKKITKEKDIKSFSITGHSMGGLVVLLADKLPIDKFILIDTLGAYVKPTPLQIEAQKIGHTKELSFLNLTNKNQLKKAMKESMYKPLYMPNFMLEHMIARKEPVVAFERKKFHTIFDETILPKDNLEEEMSNINQKTLIVWGNEDLSIDVASAYKMHKLIKHSTLKIYDKCRHYPQVEKSKALARDIIEFLG